MAHTGTYIVLKLNAYINLIKSYHASGFSVMSLFCHTTSRYLILIILNNSTFLTMWCSFLCCMLYTYGYIFLISIISFVTKRASSCLVYQCLRDEFKSMNWTHSDVMAWFEEAGVKKKKKKQSDTLLTEFPRHGLGFLQREQERIDLNFASHIQWLPSFYLVTFCDFLTNDFLLFILFWSKTWNSRYRKKCTSNVEFVTLFFIWHQVDHIFSIPFRAFG